MSRLLLLAASAAAVLVASCGSGGGGSAVPSGGSSATPTPTPTPTPSPTPSPSGCTLRERQNWAAAQLDEWYLFPETLPASRNPASYATVSDYVDALTASARAQGRDRYFTYIDSIAAEDAYYSSGQTAGFGIRLRYDSGARRLFVAEAYETAPGHAGGLRRGAEILAIGPGASALTDVSTLFARGGEQAVAEALGPGTPGLTRAMRVSDSGGTRVISLAKADYSLQPVSPAYGAKILTDSGRQVGYINLRTFISTADPALRTAFDQLRSAGVREIIVDLRYNGGGLVRIAELMSDLLGGGRTSLDVQSYTEFRPSKSQYDETRHFERQPQSLAPVKIAFITTEASASASELVINNMLPWLKEDVILVGADTYGKPVGQIAQDREACDDRLRIVAFAIRNADRQGAYFTGLASSIGRTCRAEDDISHEMGSAEEDSTRVALAALRGNSCTPLTGISTQQSRAPRPALLTPDRPTTAQREAPGSF